MLLRSVSGVGSGATRSNSGGGGSFVYYKLAKSIQGVKPQIADLVTVLRTLRDEGLNSWTRYEESIRKPFLLEVVNLQLKIRDPTHAGLYAAMQVFN